MLYITVHLFGKTKIRGELKAYEKKALAIFKKHGGEVVVAYSPERNSSETEIPDEIQVLKIFSRDLFNQFMNDPDRVVLSSERDAVIKKTVVFFSEEIIDY